MVCLSIEFKIFTNNIVFIHTVFRLLVFDLAALQSLAFFALCSVAWRRSFSYALNARTLPNTKSYDRFSFDAL